MGESTPVRVRVPAIDVDSELMTLGLRGDGSLEVPPEGFPAGWYTGGPTPVSVAMPKSPLVAVGKSPLMAR